MSDIRENLNNPDELYRITQMMLEDNPVIVGSAIAFRHPGPTIKKRPQDEEHAQELASHQPTEEYGNRHGIGSMGRKETIIHPSNIVDDMNGILDDGIIARSGTCNPRLT